MSDDSERCPSGSEDEPPQTGPASPTPACRVLANDGPTPAFQVTADAGLISVDVIENGGDWTAIADAATAVKEAARAAAGNPEAGLAGTSAAIALSCDAEVAALNANYRGKPVPTNVLSFPAPEMPADLATGDRFIGDIILAAETVTREAAEIGIPPRHHLQHLVVHGLLHLSGFDHDNDETAHRMESLETCILATLAIPDPYADAFEPAET